MEQYENEDKGSSLGDIFRTIFSQKWLALIIAVAITVVGTVGMYLYGKTKEAYSVTFVMQLPGSAESPTTYVYPDGTHFHYTDLISENNLEAAKASDEVFAGIDIKKMRKYGDISIKRELLETAAGSNSYVANYTLAIKSSYFKTEEIGREFIIKLIDMPRRNFEEMQLSYDAYLVASEDVIAYDKKINYLQSQASYLMSRYNSFISSYGEDTVANGKMLSSYRSAINVLFDNEVFEQLKSEARLNGYVISLEAAADYYNESNFENLNEQLKIEKNALENLLSVNNDQASSVIISGDRVVEQTRVVGNLELEIKYFNNFKDNKVVSEEFNNSVKNLENQIRTFTEEFRSVAQSVYSTTTTVSYEKANIVEAEGGTGLVLSVLISLIVGIVVAAAVAYIVGRVRRSRTVKQPSAQAYSEEGQLILQTAVTSDEEDDNKEEKE